MNNLKLSLLILSLVFLRLNPITAQTVIMEVEPELAEEDTAKPMYVADSRFYNEAYLSYLFMLGDGDQGADVLFFRSGDFIFFNTTFHRTFGFFNPGFRKGFSFANYKLAQNDEKDFLDTIKYDKEKILTGSFFIAPVLRFVLSEKNRKQEVYLEFSGEIHWNFLKHHVIKDDIPTHGRIKQRIGRLDYVEDLVYRAKASLGYKNFTFSVTYRLTDLFDEDYELPEFTPYTAGIGLRF